MQWRKGQTWNPGSLTLLKKAPHTCGKTLHKTNTPWKSNRTGAGGLNWREEANYAQRSRVKTARDHKWPVETNWDQLRSKFWLTRKTAVPAAGMVFMGGRRTGGYSLEDYSGTRLQMPTFPSLKCIVFNFFLTRVTKVTSMIMKVANPNMWLHLWTQNTFVLLSTCQLQVWHLHTHAI